MASAIPAARRPAARTAPWWRDPVRLAKPVVFLAALVPAGRLLHGIFVDPEALGANPAEAIEHVTGDWTLHFLLLTLAVTPLRRLTGWNGAIKFRRMLGLFAFFYGVLHMAAYVAFDMNLDASAIVKDIWKRPFVTVGFASLLLMLPLAITSTRGWVLRMGGAAWSRLHQLVYPVAILGVLHYWWLVKRDLTWPVIYGTVLVVLLGYRVWQRLRPRPARARAGA